MGIRAGKFSSRHGAIVFLSVLSFSSIIAPQISTVPSELRKAIMPAASKVMKGAPSNPQADTPSSSSTLPPSGQIITVEHVQQFMDMLKVALATQAVPTTTPQATESQAAEKAPSEEARARASRLEFKTVDEV